MRQFWLEMPARVIHTILGKPESARCAARLNPVLSQSSYPGRPGKIQEKALIEVFLSEIQVHFPHYRDIVFTWPRHRNDPF
jgi:hypothetical protein